MGAFILTLSLRTGGKVGFAVIAGVVAFDVPADVLDPDTTRSAARRAEAAVGAVSELGPREGTVGFVEVEVVGRV